jgi:hypothetical protein
MKNEFPEIPQNVLVRLYFIQRLAMIKKYLYKVTLFGAGVAVASHGDTRLTICAVITLPFLLGD